jgi:hypothetical protein
MVSNQHKSIRADTEVTIAHGLNNGDITVRKIQISIIYTNEIISGAAVFYKWNRHKSRQK